MCWIEYTLLLILVVLAIVLLLSVGKLADKVHTVYYDLFSELCRIEKLIKEINKIS